MAKFACLKNIFDDKDEEKGFSLIELIIVIVIIGILTAITVPVYGGIQDTANDTAVQEDLRVFKGVRDANNFMEGGVHPSGNMHIFNFEPSLDSYETESTDHNIVYCYNEADYQIWGLIALSKSGNSYYATDSTGIQNHEEEWGTHQQYDLCDSIGNNFTNNWRGWDGTPEGDKWRGWVGG